MSRRRASQFIHAEAESEEEGYESEEYSEDLDDFTPLAPSKSKSFTELTKELEERYAAHEQDQDVVELPTQSQLLPTPRSPLLFLIRCKVGKEKDIVHRLYENSKGYDICSIVQKEGLKGYFYIESYKKQAVEELLSTVKFVARRKYTVVPLKEMVEAVSYKKNIIVGEYARIRGGKYKGDLIKVLENYDDVVKIKAIPRINGVKKRFDPMNTEPMFLKKRGAIIIVEISTRTDF